MSLIFCLNKRAGNIYHKVHVLTKLRLVSTTSIAYVVDVLWGQPIKLIQVVSTSEFHEY